VNVECIFKHDDSVDVAKTFLRHTNENRVSRRAPRLSFRGHSVIEGRDFSLKMSTCTFKVRWDRENSNCITKPKWSITRALSHSIAGVSIISVIATSYIAWLITKWIW